MDQQSQRGRSPSAGHQAGLGLDQSNTSFDPSAFHTGGNNFLSPQQQQQQSQAFSPSNISDPAVFDPNASFGQSTGPGADATLAFNPQAQGSYLSPNLSDNGDFSLFPGGVGQGDGLDVPLFQQSTLNPNDINNMASPAAQHSPTPPHLLQPDPNQPGSAQHSPAFSSHQFSSPPSHSRNASLGPEAALLPSQLGGDWTQPQFHTHRRAPSEFSDVSSVSPSPNLVSSDSFDPDQSGHSPHQRASDGSLYQDFGIGGFSISDHQSQHGRSPSHSPGPSPHLSPQAMPDMNQQGFGLQPSQAYPGYPGLLQPTDPFPGLSQSGGDMSQMMAPSINIEMAPNNGAMGGLPAKSPMDQDSLTPPSRGRPNTRPRSVTDPFHPGGGMLQRPSSSGGLTPDMGGSVPSQHSSRSLSPLDRHGSASPSASKRRLSTNSVPNNVIALRLADPEYQSSQDAGNTKRAQKHPATFQCTLCPKRFTRAYNLRSHLRTHTDERPFVCTVCGKAFARQHDRKRHESLHSGEKKFVCKGDLKAGGQWGCGRRFARADALGRHFRSEAGRICIKPLLDEEMMERQRQWQEQNMAQNMQANMQMPSMNLDPNTGFPMDASGSYTLPAALLAQYPVLAQMTWTGPELSGDDMSGREASDYDGEDDGGYVSGPGTGFGDGSMGQNFGDMGYNSDFGGR